MKIPSEKILHTGDTGSLDVWLTGVLLPYLLEFLTLLLMETSEYISGSNAYADSGVTCCTEFSAATGVADPAAGVQVARTAVVAGGAVSTEFKALTFAFLSSFFSFHFPVLQASVKWCLFFHFPHSTP